MIDYDDPDIAELVAMDRHDRRLMARFHAHPDPRDPDHPYDDDEDIEDEE